MWYHVTHLCSYINSKPSDLKSVPALQKSSKTKESRIRRTKGLLLNVATLTDPGSLMHYCTLVLEGSRGGGVCVHSSYKFNAKVQ